MKVFKYSIKFLKLSFNEKKIFILSFYYLLFSIIVIEFLPMRFLKPFIGKPVTMINDDFIETNHEKIKLIQMGILRTLKIIPWNVKCYAQTTAAKMLLNKYSINSYLCIGLNKVNSDLKAHAWLQIGNSVIIGDKSMRSFKRIAIFR